MNNRPLNHNRVADQEPEAAMPQQVAAEVLETMFFTEAELPLRACLAGSGALRADSI